MQMTTASTKTPFGTDTATWQIDPSKSSATFAAATLWGRIPVAGRLGDVSGTLAWDGNVGRGQMAIDTAGLSSGIKLRDRHLRSRAFFDVRKHPELTLDAAEIAADGDGVRLKGQLLVRGRRQRFDCTAVAEALDGNRIALETEAPFDLDEVGMSRGLLRMILPSVRATVRVVLERATA